MHPPSYGALHHVTVTVLPLQNTNGLPAGGSAGPAPTHIHISTET
jgi:hypothetical protein